MASRRKGRGSKRSSIAPPFRLRRSVPPSDVVRSRSQAVEGRPEETEGVDDESRSDLNDFNGQESERIDGSIQKSAEDVERSSPPSYRPQAPSDDRTSNRAERWDEPGSHREVETAKSVLDDRPEDDVNGTTRDQAATAESKSQAPTRAADDSTTVDFFSKRSEDSEPERTHEQSTDAWESDYDSMSVSRESKRASYTIYAILAVVLVALGGLYFYGSPDERSERSRESRIRPNDVKSNPGTAPTASKTPESVEPKSPQAESTKSDKMRESAQTDRDPKPVETETVTADDDVGATDTPTVIDDESPAQIGANQVQPETANDEECCSSIEEYQEALRLNPNDTEILGKLAYFYLNKGMNREAKRFAERTVNIDPKSSTGWIVLGAAFDAMNDHEAAVEAYKKCAEQAVGKYLTECRNLLR